MCTKGTALIKQSIGTTSLATNADNDSSGPKMLRCISRDCKRRSSAFALVNRAVDYRIGWLANTLMSIVVIAVAITMIYYWTDICDRNPSWSYKCQNRA